MGAYFALNGTDDATTTTMPLLLTTTTAAATSSTTSSITVLETTSTNSCSGECPLGWTLNYTLNKCLINTGESVASEAAAKCAAIGGRLPVPTSQQNNVDYRTAFDAMGASIPCVVLGIVNGDNQWRDFDGNPISYFNWWNGQPNGDDEDYVCSSAYNDSMWGYWWDQRGDDNRIVICEQNKPDCCSTR